MPHLPVHILTSCVVSNLKPFANNSRLHSEEQIEQVVSSIKQFGFTNPILIDEDNIIIAGHCRVLAAQKLGLVEVPCVILKGLSESQRRAYVIADNKLALNASWDLNILKSEFEALKLDDFNLEFTGFSLEELCDLMPLDVPETFEEPQQEKESIFEIIVLCQSEQERSLSIKNLEKQGFNCKAKTV